MLTEEVDDIVTMDDFPVVSENHIIEDVNKCYRGKKEILKHWTGQPELSRDVVAAEMNNFMLWISPFQCMKPKFYKMFIAQIVWRVPKFAFL